ncbi:MAG: type III-B CRISPR-associated protein Cas10/Cmr2 [Saprospiraceae bacterium]|nr:type III-B CRISPR-associated protein Cas10/Cmr2 [Saprospiraceae bacterium]
MKNMTQYIFHFSIGPVQGFIAQARKTQDLYGGSRLLSDLCRKAIETAESKGVKIIFPYLPIGSQKSSIPNRFVGKLAITEGVDLQKIGQGIEDIVRVYFVKKAKDVLQEQKIGLPYDAIKSQIEQHLDIHWLFYEIKNNNYATAYAESEKLFGATKNFRPFKQLEEKGRKCSLDGERNVKFYRLGENEKKSDILYSKLFCNENDVELLNHAALSILQPAEGLSAVSFVKRCHNNKENGFDSTAKIALMDTLHNLATLKDMTPVNLLFEYKNFIGANDFDEQLLYPENLNSKYLKKNGFDKVKDKSAELNQKYEKLSKYLKIQKYYALIKFDGDRMGKIMGGEDLTDKSQLEAFQRRASQLLHDYGQWANAFLTNPKGRTVYTGGDDFLGFVNLNHLFEVLKELREKFDCAVSQKLKEKFRNAEGVDVQFEFEGDFNFTFSAGVVLAHYKTPLSIVLKKATDMEHQAKEKGGRDALAIAALKHSGESHEAILKWTQLGDLKDIQSALETDFSTKFIDSLQRQFTPLSKDDEKTGNDIFLKDAGKAIVESEIKRLVNRSAQSKSVSEQQKSQLAHKVIDLFASKDIPSEAHSFDNFSQLLNIAEFTQKKINRTT